MTPRDPMLDTYRKLTAEIVDRVGITLDSAAGGSSGAIQTDANGYPLVPTSAPSPNPVPREALTLWRTVPGKLKAIDDVLIGLGEQILQVTTDVRITDQARNDDIAAATSKARTKIGSARTEVLAATQRIMDLIKIAAYPARPAPADAVQEAALAGIKSDLRMVWDSLDSDALITGMEASLSRAATEGDALTAWLIASTHWPEDYLQSRGEGPRQAAWPHNVARTLDDVAPAALADARRIHRVVSDGRSGLPVFEVLFAQLDRIITNVSQWRPSASAMVPQVPPTRL